MKVWKKIICVALALALSLSLFACAGGKSKVTLNVLNWGDYIDPQLLRQFEDETGINPFLISAVSKEGLRPLLFKLVEIIKDDKERRAIEEGTAEIKPSRYAQKIENEESHLLDKDEA